MFCSNSFAYLLNNKFDSFMLAVNSLAVMNIGDNNSWKISRFEERNWHSVEFNRR